MPSNDDRYNALTNNKPTHSTANTTANKPTFKESDVLETLNANGYYQRNQLDKFTKFSRLGYFDPYNTNTVTREYIFFTKMDLHLFNPDTQTLNSEIANIPFFNEARLNHIDTMNQLQYSVRSYTDGSPFCNLLSNTVASSLDLQDISIDETETAANINGTKLIYPLATTTSSNAREFSLEFNDTKHLDVYMFFRIWYEYELLKSDGVVTPTPVAGDKNYYISNKILHDQMSCYKITVGEDFQTIIHFVKFWGVYPTSIPRSVFGDVQDGPIKVPVSFKYQWIEDMDPMILSDFNKVASKSSSRYRNEIPIYNTKTNMINGQWCHCPYIVKSTLNNRPVYKLKWR